MSDVVVRTDNLKKRYGEFVAVDDLSLEVPRGGVFGFLGPNGTGETTIIGMALGLLPAWGGRIELLGEEVSPGRRVFATLIAELIDHSASLNYGSTQATKVRIASVAEKGSSPVEAPFLFAGLTLNDLDGTILSKDGVFRSGGSPCRELSGRGIPRASSSPSRNWRSPKARRSR